MQDCKRQICSNYPNLICDLWIPESQSGNLKENKYLGIIQLAVIY